jgi:hypothetical protein
MNDRLERDITALEKEIRQLKTKLDNSIIDIRAVDYWGWVDPKFGPWEGKPEKYWTVVRHEIQYKRQGSPEWIPLPIVHRDLDDSKYTVIPLPTGELEE